jgi:hypothetical protein
MLRGTNFETTRHPSTKHFGTSGMVLMCSLLLSMRYIYKRLAAATSGGSKLCTRKAYKHELPIPETPFPSHIKNGVPQNLRAE